MSAPQFQWQLFSPAESVEDALFQIFTAQGIPAQKRFETKTNTTPRVELQMIVDLQTSLAKKIIDANNHNEQAQPDSAWPFTLLTTVVTNRTENGNQHVPLIAKSRWNLQYFRLIQTFTTTVAPYHSITNIREMGAQQDSVDDPNNLQMSQLTFRGVLNIRESAWA